MSRGHGRNREESHLLFLSHADSDAEAARALAERIEGTPEARGSGLEVWFSKRDLRAGRGWQEQIEEVLEHESTAFAVYVGSRGVINWVDAEVRVALSRARANEDYPFIPILSSQAADSEALPPFVRLYEAVRDVEGDAVQFKRLIRAAAGQETQARVALVEQPFLGLHAFGERDSALFFGREAEAQELVDRLTRTRLLMVVGDSGSGKSSLVKAGLFPKYRGGALAPRQDPRSDAIVWHVLECRPRNNPFDSLADGIAAGARAIGRSQADLRELRKMVRDQSPAEIADALRDGALAGSKILLLIDQFEELFTVSDRKYREPFIRALLALTKNDSDAEFRLVLTMRRDYYNLLYEHQALYRHIEEQDGSKFVVRSMRDDCLKSCIVEPLRLAGEEPSDVFIERVLGDVSAQPGDLALLEMCLTETWRRLEEHQGDLLVSYLAVGGVAGALANRAENIYSDQLSKIEQAQAESILIRLVQLGETAGTTRRVAARDEFSEELWQLAQRLASEQFGRLLFVSMEQPAGADYENASGDKPSATAGRFGSVELAHEALVTQWPRYQTWLQASPQLKRIHDVVIAATKKWSGNLEDKTADLLRGSALHESLRLRDERPDWLSTQERALIDEAESHEQKQIADKKARRAQEEWAEMARYFVHEIRNPLTPIRLSAEHLRMVRGNNPEPGVFEEVFERCISNILTQAEELRALLNDFMTLSRITHLPRESSNLTERLRDLIADYPQEETSDVTFEFDGGDIDIVTSFDGPLLTKAVQNLFANALKAIGPTGTVRTSITRDEKSAIITISDNGPGVAKEHLGRIFEPYFSTEDTEAGMGLAFVRLIIAAHGGEIEARNRDSGGLAVSVRLPLLSASE